MNIRYPQPVKALFADGIEREVDESRMEEAPLTTLPGMTKRKLAHYAKHGITHYLVVRFYLRGKRVWPLPA
jgi:hypothetical protein